MTAIVAIAKDGVVWIVGESSSAAAKPYTARDTSVDRGIVRITMYLCLVQKLALGIGLCLVNIYQLKGARNGEAGGACHVGASRPANVTFVSGRHFVWGTRRITMRLLIILLLLLTLLGSCSGCATHRVTVGVEYAQPDPRVSVAFEPIY